MPKLSFRRHGNALFPSDDATMEWLSDVQQGIDIVGDLRVPRNARNHRHMFAILKDAAENIDGFAAIDDLLEFLKLETGMYKVRSAGKKVTPDGSVISMQMITYESLNFESMDEVRFRRVKERFLYVLYDKYGFVPHEIEERAAQQLAAYGAERKRERKNERPAQEDRKPSRFSEDAPVPDHGERGSYRED